MEVLLKTAPRAKFFLLNYTVQLANVSTHVKMLILVASLDRPLSWHYPYTSDTWIPCLPFVTFTRINILLVSRALQPFPRYFLTQ